MSDPNFYAAPSADLGTPALEAAELSAFAGTKAPYFLSKWERALRGEGSATSFNLGALLLGVLYLLYRKLYLQSAILVGVLVLWTVVEEFLLSEPLSPGLSAGLQLALYVVIAMKTNAWYLQLASNKIATAKAEGYEGEELLEVLRARGGVNLWLPLLLFCGLVALVGFAL